MSSVLGFVTKIYLFGHSGTFLLQNGNNNRDIYTFFLY